MKNILNNITEAVYMTFLDNNPIENNKDSDLSSIENKSPIQLEAEWEECVLHLFEYRNTTRIVKNIFLIMFIIFICIIGEFLNDTAIVIPCVMSSLIFYFLYQNRLRAQIIQCSYINFLLKTKNSESLK